MPEAARVRDCLAIAKDEVGANSTIRFETVPDDAALIRRFADDLMTEYRAAKAFGREKVVFIVPVGPVGQFQIFADRCNAESVNLSDLVVINMDEYLIPDGGDFIPTSDALSFRRHMDDNFYSRLDAVLAPPAASRIFPYPTRPEETTELIASLGGVDVCFGGVGITGHLAFNDPPEPGEEMDVDAFASLPTRVVRLARETLLINSVTAARGNIDRIPKLAVTVGMKEILESRKVRIYMNRFWQSAIVRKVLHGPVTPNIPASLLQNHSDAGIVAADLVSDMPEPELR